MPDISHSSLPTPLSSLLKENDKRNDDIRRTFNPITGEGSIGQRATLTIADFPITTQHVPQEMMRNKLVRKIKRAGSIEKFYTTLTAGTGLTYDDSERDKIIEQLIRIRIRHDFPFWAALLVKIHPKGGGEDVPFILNRPQRTLIEAYERQRTAGQPIRVILAKARQWGGSTATQMYMAWLQLVIRRGLNSLIVGHQVDSSVEVEGMYQNMLNDYPVRLLYPLGAQFSDKEKKYVGTNTPHIHLVPQRSCKIKIGTAMKPDSARGGDSALVHLTEVAFFETAEKKKPADIVRSACSGALPNNPMSMIVYESSPNGAGNFFQKEYDSAKQRHSIFQAVFIAWWQIEMYRMPFKTEQQKRDFAQRLIDERNNDAQPDERHESGRYLYWLWTTGATLEAINWYIMQRSTYFTHAEMASEFPSDDDEAFTYSGNRVFDKQLVNRFRAACKPPRFIGELSATADDGPQALEAITFTEDQTGLLKVWEKPETDPDEKVNDRYLVVVDIGGRWAKADWSVIAVFDRLYMIDAEPPVVVAQWRGHIDMDLLAWKAAQIAKWYDNALLVIESNTIDTKDPRRVLDGDQAYTVLNEIAEAYPNLYARRQNEDAIKAGAPVKYGFQTNIATKPKIISVLIKVIREHLYVERDEQCLDEYLAYERKPKGINVFGAIEGHHDDILMTRAIAMQVCFYEMPTPTITAITHHRHTPTVISEATL